MNITTPAQGFPALTGIRVLDLMKFEARNVYSTVGSSLFLKEIGSDGTKHHCRLPFSVACSFLIFFLLHISRELIDE